MKLGMLRDMDYFGIITMAIGLGSLEYVLEEGERKDWFGNVLIFRFAWVAAIFITLFFIRELTAKKPFLNLGLFRYRSFTLSCIIQTALGLGLYGTVFVVPEYLASVQGYSATEIGTTLMWVGIPQLFILPFVPKIIKIIDIRLVIGFGGLFFALSCFMNAFLDPDYAGPQFAVANIVRALGQPLMLIPLLSVATVEIPPQESGSASALFNMMRNLGGSMGIALLSTLITNREHLHSVRIGSTVTAESPQVAARIEALTNMLLMKGLDPATAGRTALKILSGSISEQAFLMAYGDAFFVVGTVMAATRCFCSFLSANRSNWRRRRDENAFPCSRKSRCAAAARRRAAGRLLGRARLPSAGAGRAADGLSLATGAAARRSPQGIVVGNLRRSRLEPARGAGRGAEPEFAGGGRPCR